MKGWGQVNYNLRQYDPPSPYKNWEDVITGNNIHLEIKNNLFVFSFESVY